MNISIDPPPFCTPGRWLGLNPPVTGAVSRSCAGVLVAWLVACPAAALELGIESTLSVDFSDNVFFVNNANRVDGTIGAFGLTIFGEQKGDLAKGGFVAEFQADKIFEDSGNPDDAANDNDLDSFTRFFGGVTLATPLRSVNWYLGDVLDGVLGENQLQSLDSTGNRRVNILVTGPEFRREISGVSRLESNLYYANETNDEDGDVESLYNFSTTYTRRLLAGKSWGLRVADIYTDKPAGDTLSDFNRLSGQVFALRDRNSTKASVAIGGTQYRSENRDTTSGLRVNADVERNLSSTRSVRVGFSHDLNDQSLNTFQSVIGGDSTSDLSERISVDTGVVIEFESQASADNGLYLRFSAVESDTEFVAGGGGFTEADANLQDKRTLTAGAGLSRSLSPRLNLFVDLSYEQRDFTNLPDIIDSTSMSLTLRRALNNRWAIELGGKYLQESGTITQTTATGQSLADIDSTESRLTVGIRWQPPSRASKDAGGVVKSFIN